MSMKSVLDEELKLISLSRVEVLELEKVARDFIVSLKKVGVSAFVGGSLAKGTMTRKILSFDVAGRRSQVIGHNKQDVDIFVVFDYSEDVVKLEKVLRKVKLPGKLKKVHGSRDYFQIDCGNVLLEVIPVVKNKNPELAENVTDVSLRHVKFVVGEIKRNSKLADEIRLAKAFCWANRVYGAEGYVRGFSGYALEVLVIYFGSFVKFLKKICGGRRSPVAGRKIVVDSLKYFKNGREVLNEINASKLNSPIVLVDPTYKYRNVTAGLGVESFGKFLSVAKEFLKSPSLDFFKLKSVDVEGMKKMKGRFVEVELSTDRQEGDIAGTKMKKLLDFFARELERNGQKILRREFDYLGFGKKAKGYLIVVEKKEIEVRGPPILLKTKSEKGVGSEEVVGKFLRVNKRRDVFKKKGFWFVRKKMSVEKVFDLVKKVEGEMGARISL